MTIEGLHGRQAQCLYHVEGALLVFLKVVGLEMTLIGFLGSIDLEDSDAGGVKMDVWTPASSIHGR